MGLKWLLKALGQIPIFFVIFWSLRILTRCYTLDPICIAEISSKYKKSRLIKRFVILYFGKYGNRRLGGAQPGNRFVSFVRAYARSGCLVESDQKFCGPGFCLFPLG